VSAIVDGRVVLLGADAAGGVMTGVTSGTSIPQYVTGHSLVTIFLASQGTTSGGTVIIEEADYSPRYGNPYTGTWSQIQSIAASTFTGGAQIAVAMGPRAFGAIQVRISSAITGGGTISAVIRWN
jgi:hypothetical protein